MSLVEVTGTTPCREEETGAAVEYRFWAGVVEGKKPLHFRVSGAAALLDPWRADVITFLQSLEKK